MSGITRWIANTREDDSPAGRPRRTENGTIWLSRIRTLSIVRQWLRQDRLAGPSRVWLLAPKQGSPTGCSCLHLPTRSQTRNLPMTGGQRRTPLPGKLRTNSSFGFTSVGPAAASRFEACLRDSRRVLEFPATAQRRPTAASSRQLPPPPGSLLAAEPAYRSALSHLRVGGRPGTAPASGSTSLPPAAPPSSRLDALLVGRPGTAAATAARPVSSRLDALLARNTTAVAPVTAHHPPLAAAPARSRLDELLAARPPPLATTNARLPSSRLDQLLAARPALRPATAASAVSGRGASSTANGGHSSQPQPATLSLPGRGAPAAATAALSPVEEEPAGASQTARSELSGAGRSAPATANAARAGGRGGLPAGAAGAEVRPPAGGMPDPALQERLRERIELAKVGPCLHLNYYERGCLAGGRPPPDQGSQLPAVTPTPRLLAEQPASLNPGAACSTQAAAAALCCCRAPLSCTPDVLAALAGPTLGGG